tara:strand:+ start:254 stop:550 length:297 start_codon:yes stop_codon:yes gene_type:complete
MAVFSLTAINLMRRRNYESFKNYLNGDFSNLVQDNMFNIIYTTLIIIVMAIPGVLVAINCNTKNPIRYGILGFIFSDIYLLQWSIKKFIMKYPDYCPL